ncbi:MAG: S49 family peptidase [Pseudomonadota bacterium]
MMRLLSKIRESLPFVGEKKPSVTVVSLYGAIAVDARPGRGLSANGVEEGLRKAFKDKSSKAVILAINSPGGAPAQARMIMERARHLAKDADVPVISYIEDVGASGGYMIALAGEEIWADPFAIVGSIGVVSAGFGFQEAIEKIGVERRVYHAGDNKVRLDPFRPENPEDTAKLERLLGQTHTLFIDMVRESRGDRLNAPDETIFSGDFFLADEGKTHGLVDEVGDLRTLIKDRYGEKTKVRLISGKRGGLFSALGASVGHGVVNALRTALREEDLRARLGL